MISLYINGVAYNYPEPDEPPGWGDEATAWAVAVTQNLIPKNGGLFNLFGDVNFGPSNGLISNYFKSASTGSLGSVGVVRLAYDDVMSFRNAADDGDILIGVNVDGNLTVNGSPVGLPNPGPAGTYLYSNGSLVSWKSIDFSELAGNIAVSQLDGGLGATSSTFFAGDGNWKAVGFDMLSGNIAVSQINSGTGASASTYLSGDGTWKSFPGSNTQVLFRGGANGVTTDPVFHYENTVLTVGKIAVNGAAGRVSSTSGGLQLYSPSSQALVLRAGVTNTSGPFPSTLNGQVLIEGNDVDITSNTTMNLDALNMRLGGADIDINAGQVDIQGDYGAKKVTVDSNGIGLTFGGKPLLVDGSAGTSTWVLTSNGPGAAPSWQEVSATGVVPGSNTQVLFNDSGVLGADADFTYDKTLNVLTVPTLAVQTVSRSGTLTLTGTSGVNITSTSTGSSISTSSNGLTSIQSGTGLGSGSLALDLYASNGQVRLRSQNGTLSVTGSAATSISSTGAGFSASGSTTASLTAGTVATISGGTNVDISAGASGRVLITRPGTNQPSINVGDGASVSISALAGSFAVSAQGGNSFAIENSGFGLTLNAKPFRINGQQGTAKQVFTSNGAGSPAWETILASNVDANASPRQLLWEDPVTGTITGSPAYVTDFVQAIRVPTGTTPLQAGYTVDRAADADPCVPMIVVGEERSLPAASTAPAGDIYVQAGNLYTIAGLTGVPGTTYIRGGRKGDTVSVIANGVLVNPQSPGSGGNIVLAIARTGVYENSLKIVGSTGAWAVGASELTGTAGQVLTSNGSGAAPSWQTPSSGLSAPNYEEQVATAAQTVFNTTVNTVAAGSGSIYLIVYVNGVKQREGATKAFTVTGANQITFNAGLAAGDEVEFVSFV